MGSDKLRAFYGSKFSPNQTQTPEGFLVCLNVPIARTGEQEYLGEELGLNEKYGEVVKVVRPEKEVFSEAAIASFEGKPVTDDHPSQSLEPSNYSAYLKGVAQNVRRGGGQDQDKLFADLVIYDPTLISEIQAGKREISCGYDCQYVELDNGSFEQRTICGNHVAVVNNGRAGANVAIRDSVPEKGAVQMKETSKKSVLAKMFHAFAKDATPDEVEVALDELGANEEVKDEEQAVKDEDVNAEVLAAIAALAQRIEKLEKPTATDEVDPISELEKELVEEDEAPSEESVTVSAEEVNDEEAEEKTNASDRQTVLNAIKAIKPAIASMKDSAERKRVSDAITAELRKTISAPKGKTQDGYTEILKATHKRQAMDAAAQEDAYKSACDARNPHKQGGK